MINSGNLGLAALLTVTDTASHALRQELTLCREMVARPVVFEGLRGLAAEQPRRPRGCELEPREAGLTFRELTVFRAPQSCK